MITGTNQENPQNQTNCIAFLSWFILSRTELLELLAEKEVLITSLITPEEKANFDAQLEILGLTPTLFPKNMDDIDAFESAVKKAYKTLARELHPDKEGGNASKFQPLEAAYKTLLALKSVVREKQQGMLDEQQQDFVCFQIKIATEQVRITNERLAKKPDQEIIQLMHTVNAQYPEATPQEKGKQLGDELNKRNFEQAVTNVTNGISDPQKLHTFEKLSRSMQATPESNVIQSALSNRLNSMIMIIKTQLIVAREILRNLLNTAAIGQKTQPAEVSKATSPALITYPERPTSSLILTF